MEFLSGMNVSRTALSSSLPPIYLFLWDFGCPTSLLVLNWCRTITPTWAEANTWHSIGSMYHCFLYVLSVSLHGSLIPISTLSSQLFSPWYLFTFSFCYVHFPLALIVPVPDLSPASGIVFRVFPLPTLLSDLLVLVLCPGLLLYSYW